LSNYVISIKDWVCKIRDECPVKSYSFVTCWSGNEYRLFHCCIHELLDH